MLAIEKTQKPARRKRRRALQARSEAQMLAFSPVVFYAAIVMRDAGVLSCLAKHGAQGATEDELMARTGLERYALSVLLGLGDDAGLLERREGEFVLTDLGYLVEGDTMTRINMNFVKDVCYQALPFMGESLREGRPAGLHTLGDWDTIYDGLCDLPQPARKSWYEFDHYYSDAMFEAALARIFDRPVHKIMDIGANTGRWASKCLHYHRSVRMHLVDLPAQLAVARKNLESEGLAHRADFQPMDVRSANADFAADCDLIWMSQFLDCLDPNAIKSLLRRLRSASGRDTRLCIVEPFTDRQAFRAASLSVNATSLYFSCVANGVSRMYPYEEFVRWVEASGWKLESVYQFSAGHTLISCQPD